MASIVAKKSLIIVPQWINFRAVRILFFIFGFMTIIIIYRQKVDAIRVAVKKTFVLRISNQNVATKLR